MYFGAQYYRPPFPDKKYWERDIKNMKELGFNTVKLWAVWNDIEREEGIFNFEDLDQLVELCDANGLKVLINTIPEGAPYWAYELYSDALYKTANNYTVSAGGPANLPTAGWPGFCMDNPNAAGAVCNFLYNVAKHYKDNKAVFAIDVWNEPHLEPMFDYPTDLLCYCDGSKKAFVEWLMKKYGSLEELNKAWFRRYNDWSQITPPPRFGTYTDMMDWRRFWLENLARWLDMRLNAVKKGAPEKLLQTHVAFSGLIGTFGDGGLANELGDEFLLARNVDTFGLSSFPRWLMGDEYMFQHLLHSEIVAEASREKPFYQVELQGGPGKPGLLGHITPSASDVRVWNWNTIAAGGKGVVYWQYAPEPAGLESPGFGLVDYSGCNTERSIEAGRIARYFTELGLDASTRVLSTNGIYLSRTTDLFAFAAGRNEKMYARSIYGAYKAMCKAGIPVRFVHGDYIGQAYEEGLRVLYVPMPIALDEKEKNGLLAFAMTGGTVVSEACPGMYSDLGVNDFSNSFLRELFGLTGANVEMCGKDGVVTLPADGAPFRGALYRQTVNKLHDDVKVLGRFEDGKPAICTCNVGKGHAVWIGTFPALAYEMLGCKESANFIVSFMDKKGYAQIETLECGGAIVRLLKDKDDYIVVAVNHNNRVCKVVVKKVGGIPAELEVMPFDGALTRLK